MIQYLRHDEIDLSKWDECVKRSSNGFIYHHSFYLNGMCEWDALVSGEYEYIMPLPIRSKFGIKYIYTPAFVAQMGIVGNRVDGTTLTSFLNAIPQSIRFIDMMLNEGNNFPGLKDGKQKAQTNLILPLSDPYELILERYNKDAKKNLRRNVKFDLVYKEGIDPNAIMNMYRAAYGRSNTNTNSKDYKNFLLVIDEMIRLGKGFTAGIYSGNDLVATAFFGKDDKRIYYLLGAPTRKGRDMKAIYFLVDEVIRRFSGSKLFFDFEGSDIPSVAFFYRKFSPVEKVYPRIIINRLPVLLRLLKS